MSGRTFRRTFLVSRTQSMLVTLTDDDIAEQEHYGETSEDSALVIAEHSPDSSWATDDITVEAMR